jgi:hypothetical protein
MQMTCCVDRYKDSCNYINTKQDADTKYNDFVFFREVEKISSRKQSLNKWLKIDCDLLGIVKPSVEKRYSNRKTNRNVATVKLKVTMRTLKNNMSYLEGFQSWESVSLRLYTNL